MPNIYLVGFMGTGKTSVGKLLAKEKKWQFVDLDDLIEFRQRRRIADIFTKEGEKYFRRIEKETLKEAAKEKNFVIACGGGAVIDPDNIKTMKKTGAVVCLVASPEEILKRTASESHRPLLNVANPKKQIELLLKLRAPYYILADKTLDTTGISIQEVVKRINKVLLPRKRLSNKSKKKKAK